MMTQESLMTFLQESQGLREVEVDSLLFSNGSLDSVSQLDLIMYIEKHAGFQVSPMDLTLENFDSVRKIMAFVELRSRR